VSISFCRWEEWGNPSEEEFFDYMLSYSPMNNVRSDVTYPSMLITGGLWDPRVQYYEPTKFAATVRYAQRDRPDRNPVLLKIDDSSGHFSASDRYQHLKQQAFEYSVLLDQLGLLQQ
jgi:oligopeptidase B